MSTQQTYAAVGYGNMGKPVADSFVKANPNADFMVIDPTIDEKEVHPAIQKTAEGANTPEALSHIANSDVLILAFKPKDIGPAADTLKENLKDGSLVVSMLAGIKVETIASHLPDNQAIIRIMPNTPAELGEGITALYANDFVTDEQKAEIEELLTPAGEVLWTKDENLFNPITALSGSGPAYVFHLIESLSVSFNKAGMDAKAAKELARTSVIEAAQTLKANPDKSGTTLSLETNNSAAELSTEVQTIFNTALNEAAERGNALGKSNPPRIDNLPGDFIGLNENASNSLSAEHQKALGDFAKSITFQLSEVMAQAGKQIRLPEDMAKKLARQTVIGAAALADKKVDIDAAQLRKNVTSHQGTTQAALLKLMDGELQETLDKGVAQSLQLG